MQLMNSSSSSSEPSAGIKDGTEDLDECAAPESPCGRGAVCQNTVGSFRCFCAYDMTALESHQDCSPPRVFSENEMNNGIGVFKTEDLYDIVKPIQTTASTTTMAVTLDNHGLMSTVNETGALTTRNASATQVHSDGAGSWTSTIASGHALPVLLGVTAAGILLAVFVVSLVMYLLWNRRRRRRGPSATMDDGRNKLSMCCCFYWQPPKTAMGLKALRKSAILGSQQFMANPNYYTAPPERALLKSLLHLEIAGEKLVFLDIIGEGCFGKVFKGMLQKRENEICEVAIKILKENSSSETQVDFLREVEIMSSFNHPNILALLGVVDRDGSVPWMVFEYMEYGDLAELLRSNSPHPWSATALTNCKITKDDLNWLALQVAQGMAYLSSQHFVHRDLATRNCLVGHDLIVKIADFGMSRDIYTCDYYKIGGSRMLLPLRWMAPESVMYGLFTLQSDVWSYGVVLWEIFAYGKQPYYGHTNEEVVKLIRQRTLLQPPDDCPRYVSVLMEKSWTSNPYDRIKFTQIIEYLRLNGEERVAGIHRVPGHSAITAVRHNTTTTTTNNNNNNAVGSTDRTDAVDHQNYLVPQSSTNANQH